ncbi:UDP-N-acetylenolpyruvoylglucosamine reductase [Fibrobacter sp. UWB4]|uniref:UDP-N-acetylmuramate dehydrogenase n=1 Tax=Fibrobacter sp. UWB4 TaxID=1964356 RepID=UPI000B51F85C|nr:UDP-N-acetylmuramate dehydrogenase [Fibrobacter sp. UWB4]OWV19975.1 UDP-N-acetylenolpyruvoylglucosamine reductase [Fibrobacter sp. UWB4]
MIIQENVPMSEHTSFKVGGPARYFVKAESVNDIKDAIAFANEHALPSFVIGKGTNLLVSDSGYKGVIIQLGKFFSEITNIGNGKICAKGATPLARLARYTINEGLAGIHKLAGIPGSLGGAIYMNAGAYGQDVSQTCIEVESIDSAGNLHTRTAADCKFGYRHSIFQDLAASRENAETILSATFQLTPATELNKTAKDLESEMQECMTKRRNSQPLSMPNAGSTFKRLDAGAAETPTQIAPGYYIEQAGLKGYRIGGAEVSRVHANFIVNADHATAADIKSLSEYVQKVVAEKFGIQLHREVILLGEF